jgi:DNA-binding HxlR family transcriptional regulator
MDAVTEVDEVVWMVRGAWVTLSIRATCELGVVDALDEPRSLSQLAARTGCDQATLARLLRVLVDLGLVARADDRYAATPRGDVLRAGHPSRVRDLALMQTAIPNLTAWQHLADSIRHAAPVYEALNGQSLWDRLAAHPDEQALFNAVMARRGFLQAQAIRAAVDLSGTSLLVDVGGGDGALVAALLAVAPHMSAVVADQPDVARSATTALAAAGLGSRAHGQPTDFFTAVPPGADMYVLSNVLHDWDDERATMILRTVRTAMSTTARLLVVEHVLDAPDRGPWDRRDIHLVDLHMLVMFGARERTKTEYDSLLTSAGFAPSTLKPSPNTWNVLATVPAH